MNNQEQALAQAKSFSVIKIPKEHFEFMNRNPKLTQFVGQLLMEIHGAKKHIKDCEDILNFSEELRAEVQSGTPEEVENFIQGAITGAEFGITDFDDLEPGVAQQVRNELGIDNVMVSQYEDTTYDGGCGEDQLDYEEEDGDLG